MSKGSEKRPGHGMKDLVQGALDDVSALARDLETAEEPLDERFAPPVEPEIPLHQVRAPSTPKPLAEIVVLPQKQRKKKRRPVRIADTPQWFIGRKSVPSHIDHATQPATRRLHIGVAPVPALDLWHDMRLVRIAIASEIIDPLRSIHDDAPSRRVFPGTKIRVYVADRIRSAISYADSITDNDDVEIIGMARGPEDLWNDIAALDPDVLLLAEGFGVQSLAKVARQLRETTNGTRLVVMSDNRSLLKSTPVQGLIPENASAEDVITAIRRAAVTPIQPWSAPPAAETTAEPEVPPESAEQPAPPASAAETAPIAEKSAMQTELLHALLETVQIDDGPEHLHPSRRPGREIFHVAQPGEAVPADPVQIIEGTPVIEAPADETIDPLVERGELIAETHPETEIEPESHTESEWESESEDPTDLTFAYNPESSPDVLAEVETPSPREFESPIPRFSLDINGDATSQLDLSAVQAIPAAGSQQTPDTVTPKSSLDQGISELRRGAVAKLETNAKIFVVFSGKGGVGKSVIASNLAAALAAQPENKVALVDMSLQFGDAAIMLNAESRPTTIDALIQDGQLIDPELIREAIYRGKTNVSLLAAPMSPEYADLVTFSNIRAIIEEMAAVFDYIIVDSAPLLDERILEFIEKADRVIVVSNFEITAVKDTKVTLRLLHSLDVRKVSVVLNQIRGKVPFGVDAVEEQLRMRIMAQLPYEPKIQHSIETGNPVVLSAPKSRYSTEFKSLVSMLVAQTNPEAPAVKPPRTGRKIKLFRHR